jgi:DNA-binding NtrC family response regulator
MACVAFGNHVLDVEARRLLREGVPVHLEPKVMDLLICLMGSRGRFVSKDELKQALWPEVHVGEASLTRLVKQLRKTLRACGEDGSIRTLHGRGYEFTAVAASTPPESQREREPLSDRSVDALATLHRGPTLSRVLRPLESMAGAGLPVVIEGETGTGKEAVAHAVHAWSARAGGVIALRCAGLSDHDLHAALSSASAGADTLLLDEVGELTPLHQRLLLATLAAERTCLPSALSRRIVATSQRSLIGLVRAGTLRSDLVARLSGIAVELPPLRERPTDVADLMCFLFSRWGAANTVRPPAATLKLLLSYDWPFNVWELEMYVRRYIAWFEAGRAAQLEPAPCFEARCQPAVPRPAGVT